MSTIVDASVALRRIALSAAFVFCCSPPAWSQRIDLEAVGLTVVPAGLGRFDITPVIAGQVSASVNNLKIRYSVFREGTVIVSGDFTLRYPPNGPCAPATPFHCGGGCTVELVLSINTPPVSVAGDCTPVAIGGCWCSFPPVELRTSNRRLRCKDSFSEEDLTLGG